MARKEKVTKIVDSCSFLTDKRKHPVTLANVDTPAMRQPGYKEAKQALSDLILNQVVSINTVGRDKNSRSIAKVMCGRKSVNKAMQAHKKKK